jgi:alanyl-tRNA synthetase
MGTLTGSGKGRDGQTYSLELCGGTHVRQTGDIGVFAILSEQASSSGVRRIEALTGAPAMDMLRTRDQQLAQVEQVVKAQGADVAARVEALMEERKKLEAEVAHLRQRLAMSGGGASGPEAVEIGGTKFLAQSLSGVTGKDLAGLIDAHKEKLGSGAVLLVADTGGKVAVAAGVTEDLTGRVSAVDLVRAAVEKVGGKGGGGRADFAQGGGKDFAGAGAAIDAAKAVFQGE